MSATKTRVRPGRAALGAVLRAAPNLAPRAEKVLWRGFYELASRSAGSSGTVMNYGYAHADEGPGTPEHFGLQLYEQVASGADLTGKDVLEVGCGRGTGAAHVHARSGSESMTGLDLAHKAIERAKARYTAPGLSFVAGDAENLPFPDASFDAVMSVESSHCYPSVPRFLAEVFRVLRPGGHFLIVDFRHTVLPPDADEALVQQEDLAMLRDQFTAAGFETVDEVDITGNVERSLRVGTEARKAEIGARAPKLLRKRVLEFAAVEGSQVHVALRDGEWTYMRWALRKPE